MPGVLALIPESIPQVRVYLGVVCIEMQCALITGDGQVELALGCQRIAQVAVGLGQRRLEPHESW